jgi:DNA-binding MarR family transcriptional regulator
MKKRVQRMQAAVEFISRPDAPHGGVSPTEIAEAIGIPRGHTGMLLNRLKAKGVATNVDGKWLPVASPEAAAAPNGKADGKRVLLRDRILELVKAKPGLTRGQIATELDETPTYVSDTVRKLVEAGALRVTERRGGRGPPAQVFPADGTEPAQPAEAPKKPRARRNGVHRAAPLSAMPLEDFQRFCDAADLHLEQGLALGYRLIVQQLTGQLKLGVK